MTWLCTAFQPFYQSVVKYLRVRRIQRTFAIDCKIVPRSRRTGTKRQNRLLRSWARVKAQHDRLLGHFLNFSSYSSKWQKKRILLQAKHESGYIWYWRREPYAKFDGTEPHWIGNIKTLQQYISINVLSQMPGTNIRIVSPLYASIIIISIQRLDVMVTWHTVKVLTIKCLIPSYAFWYVYFMKFHSDTVWSLAKKHEIFRALSRSVLANLILSHPGSGTLKFPYNIFVTACKIPKNEVCGGQLGRG